LIFCEVFVVLIATTQHLHLKLECSWKQDVDWQPALKFVWSQQCREPISDAGHK
jgi:hypothetical protein